VLSLAVNTLVVKGLQLQSVGVKSVSDLSKKDSIFSALEVVNSLLLFLYICLLIVSIPYEVIVHKAFVTIVDMLQLESTDCQYLPIFYPVYQFTSF